MGQADVVDAEVFGKRHRFACQLAGLGVERLSHECRLPDVEQIAWGCVLDSGLTLENRLLVGAIHVGDPDLSPVLALEVHVQELLAAGQELWPADAQICAFRGSHWSPERSECRRRRQPS